MRRATVVVGVLVVAFCLAGCGGGDYSSPKATFNTMWDAAKAGKKDAMMACFAGDTRKKMEEMEKLMAEMKASMPADAKEKADEGSMTDQMMKEAKKAKVEIGAEKIDGDKATLEVTTDGKKDTLNFVKEGGAWKMSLPISDEELNQMKQGIEMMKQMSKGMKKGVEGMKSADK